MFTFMNTIPPYWKPLKDMFYEMVGNPETDSLMLREVSPVFLVDKIKAPLFVAQGANDPRVNKRESDQIVIALRDRGFPVEYLVAPDEGHGFARPVNNMAMFASADEMVTWLTMLPEGFYRQVGTSDTARMTVWHDPMRPRAGALKEASFELLDRLGIVPFADQTRPFVVFLQPRIDFYGVNPRRMR